MTQEAPIERRAVRLVLFDPGDRVLLFRAVWPGSGRAFWITPGGGVHAGETDLEALRRELWEETGLREATIGPCVWLREHTFAFEGTWLAQKERYFVARCDDHEVITDHQEDLERRFLADHRWWTIEEIAASGERFVPADFAALARPLRAGEWPAAPIIVGR